MIELYLLSFFQKRGLKLYHTVPTTPLPYAVWDRTSGALDTSVRYDEASFAIDCYGANLGQIETMVNSVRRIVRELKLDPKINRAEITNLVDNSTSDETVYTVYLAVRSIANS